MANDVMPAHAMLDDAQVATYLARLDFHATPGCNRATLDDLHLAHMLRVPFENLDIMQGIPIDLSLAGRYAKLVLQQRGGFCHELNSLFADLLQAIGFEVRLLAAEVHDGQAYTAPFDHMLLAVALDGRTLVADVGFGDSFRLPLAIDGTRSQQGVATYDVVRQGEEYTLFRTRPDTGRQPQYRFRLDAHALEEFLPRCRHQQHSPQSHFTQQAICSRATADGRVSLSAARHILTTARSRSERRLENADEYRAVLQRDFNITLDETADIAPLMAARKAN